jgi:transcriptional regulator GlxA family with amidase domain
MLISILIFDGADELDFIAPCEILRHAAGIDNRHEIELVTPVTADSITAAHGLQVHPDGRFTGETDLLIIPGGGWVNHAAQGIRTEIESGSLVQRVADAREYGAKLAAICTGAMALAHAGLLDGRKATTHQGALEDLRAFDRIDVVEARVVDDGDIMTCGGVTSGIDLSLWLVERFWGQSIAGQVACYIEYRRSKDLIIQEH